MAATDIPLTWGGLPRRTWSDEGEGEEAIGMLKARLQAKDAALEDLQRRLEAALQEAEKGRAQQAALQRRAEKAEQAEEALALQMAELEAEAFTRITESNKLLAAYQQAADTSEKKATGQLQPVTPSQLPNQVEELQSRLQAALEEAAAWAQRCKELEEVVEQGRAREAAMKRQVEKAEEAEEALASEIAELEAEAFTRLTENNKLIATLKRQAMVADYSSLEQICHVETDRVARSQVVELQRRLIEAERELEAVHTKLRQLEEKKCWLELRLAQQQEGEKKSHQLVALKSKQGEEEPGYNILLSLLLQDLDGFVKLKLWNPSSLSLTCPSA
eukprot:c24233_g1_i1 orf=42-1037(+)